MTRREWSEPPPFPPIDRTPRIDVWLQRRRWLRRDRWEWVADIGCSRSIWRRTGSAPTKSAAIEDARVAAVWAEQAALENDERLRRENVTEYLQ